ncbi:DUF6221 family protein [Streptomyces sp. Inha503]|uniref:DUF6221 family protein n=1 Tax=Streptomyces sp. Inha503 TaxID=3383314 RepID=UPI0039A0BEF8
MRGDLVWFLILRLLEDELTSQQATHGPWPLAWHGQTLQVCRRGEGAPVVAEFTYAIPAGEPEVHEARAECDTRDAEHIARHHPTRVLAEIEAKRRLMAEVFSYEAKIDGEWGCGHSADDIAAGLCPETDPSEITALRLLALCYADHPDHRDEWRP